MIFFLIFFHSVHYLHILFQLQLCMRKRERESANEKWIGIEANVKALSFEVDKLRLIFFRDRATIPLAQCHNITSTISDSKTLSSISSFSSVHVLGTLKTIFFLLSIKVCFGTFFWLWIFCDWNVTCSKQMNQIQIWTLLK